jgi:adenylate cyclase
VNPLERDLARAIVESERLRVQIILAGVAIFAFGFLAETTLFPSILADTFRGRVSRPWVLAALGAIGAMELAVASRLTKLLATGGDLTAPARYAHAFVEVSIPTLTLVFVAGIFGPVHAILLPPSFGYFLFIVLSTLRLDFALSVFTGAVAALEYAAFALWAVRSGAAAPVDPILLATPHHTGKAFTLLLCGVIAGLIGRQIRRQFQRVFELQEERRKVVDVFGRHVSPEVVAKLLDQPADLTSEVRHVCVMFLDIRNFTTFSEKRSPEEVVAYLNALFGFMVDAVNEHHGIVNKFLGDGFMAIFGAPLSDGRDCRNAVGASRAILKKLEEHIAAGKLPPTKVGIGLHAGPAVTGTVGSVSRKEYTVIGDVVNLASRIESLNKELGSQVLASDEAWRQVGPDGGEAVSRGPMMVKGRAEPVQVWQLA